MSKANHISKVVAIDGPAGAGKSSVTKLVSKKLNLLYIDTGSMFRALAYMAHSNSVAFIEGPEMSHFLVNLKMEYSSDQSKLIIVNGENLSSKIREHYVSELASKISSIPSVRLFLLDFQRRLVQDQVAVMEGRDIGTVVFPDAFCKIFLSASFDVRAKRRMEELKTKGQTDLNYDAILKDIKDRDERDRTRDIAPLIQADDAIVVDSSSKTMEEVVDDIVLIVRTQAQKKNISLI
ncbi:MAG: (d)CMP kinase [Bacteriovoracaceae bacterium]